MFEIRSGWRVILNARFRKLLVRTWSFVLLNWDWIDAGGPRAPMARSFHCDPLELLVWGLGDARYFTPVDLYLDYFSREA